MATQCCIFRERKKIREKKWKCRVHRQLLVTDIKGEEIIHGVAFQTLDEFHAQLEKICGTDQLDISLKKPDKKKER